MAFKNWCHSFSAPNFAVPNVARPTHPLPRHGPFWRRILARAAPVMRWFDRRYFDGCCVPGQWSLQVVGCFSGGRIPPPLTWNTEGGEGGGGWHEVMVLVCWPLAAPIGLSPLLSLTLCRSERVLVVSTEPPDDLSCLTTPGVGRPGDGAVARAVDQVHPDAPSESMRGFADSAASKGRGGYWVIPQAPPKQGRPPCHQRTMAHEQRWTAARSLKTGAVSTAGPGPLRYGRSNPRPRGCTSRGVRGPEVAAVQEARGSDGTPRGAPVVWTTWGRHAM